MLVGRLVSGSPAAGDWAGIQASGSGSLDVEHAVVEYGTSVGGQGFASLVALNDTFSSDGGLAAVLGTGASVTVKNNSFVSPSGSAVVVSSPQLQLSGNTASGISSANVGGQAYWAESSALDFAALSSNTADAGGLVVSGSAVTSTWSGSIPLLLETGGETVQDFASSAVLDVPSGATLTLAPGTIVKGQGQGSYRNGHAATARSRFRGRWSRRGRRGRRSRSRRSTTTCWWGVRVGVAAAQVIGQGLWSGWRTRIGAHPFDTHVRRCRWPVGLARRSMERCCTRRWGRQRAMSFVDATNVDRGDPSGPWPIGTGSPYSGGGVLVTPWVGYVAPTVPANTDPYVPPSSYQFASVAFIGARGSGEAPQGDPPTFSGPDNGLGTRVGENWSRSLLKNVTRYGSYGPGDIKELGVQYRALGTLFEPLKLGNQALHRQHL